MSESKFANAVVMALTILFLLFCANLVLGVGIGILGVFFSLVGGLLKLLLSKEVITLAAIGLVIYLLSNRKRVSNRDPYYY